MASVGEVTVAADKGSFDWIRYSGIGFELAGATAGFALIGYWVDKRFGTSPWGVVVGVVLGLVGGLYSLVTQAFQAAHDAGVEDEARRLDRGKPEE